MPLLPGQEALKIRFLCYGEKMTGTGNGQGRYSTRYGHTANELQPREKLVKLSRQRAAKMRIP
jgi:hypothetical protein